MFDRRIFLFAAAATLFTADTSHAFLNWRKRKKRRNRRRSARQSRPRKPFKLDQKFEPQQVSFDRQYPKGSIVINPEARYLYFIEKPGVATRYGVGVGRAGMSIRGTAYIARKARWPSWTPTRNMIRREPRYARYAGGMPGGINNPLGARALYLYRGKQDTYYRIHGTNQPSSIGRAMSSGCVRMLNRHVEQLYEKASVGALVVILKPGEDGTAVL